MSDQPTKPYRQRKPTSQQEKLREIKEHCQRLEDKLEILTKLTNQLFRSVTRSES